MCTHKSCFWHKRPERITETQFLLVDIFCCVYFIAAEESELKQIGLMECLNIFNSKTKILCQQSRRAFFFLDGSSRSICILWVTMEGRMCNRHLCAGMYRRQSWRLASWRNSESYDCVSVWNNCLRPWWTAAGQCPLFHSSSTSSFPPRGCKSWRRTVVLATCWKGSMEDPGVCAKGQVCVSRPKSPDSRLTHNDDPVHMLEAGVLSTLEALWISTLLSGLIELM